MVRATWIVMLLTAVQAGPTHSGAVPLLHTDDLKGLQEFLLQHGR